MNLNYGEILTRAWQIVWKYKILWVFGILAGCARGGGGGSGGAGGGRGNGDGGGQPGGPIFPQFERSMEQFGRWISENPWVIVLVVLTFIVLWVLFIYLGTIGKIGLIQGTLKAEKGAERMAFGELFGESSPFFWRIFGLSFLVGLAFLIIFLPLILIGFLTAGLGFLCILPLVCILFPISLIVAVVLEQANAAIVIENLSMFDGLKRGWDVVKSNAVNFLLMSLILFGIGLVAGLIIALPVLLVVFPTAVAFGIGEARNLTPLIVGGVCFVAYLPVLLTANGILTAFTQSAWTLTFLRLTQRKEQLPVVVEANA